MRSGVFIDASGYTIYVAECMQRPCQCPAEIVLAGALALLSVSADFSTGIGTLCMLPMLIGSCVT
jgi:hypothetical protein